MSGSQYLYRRSSGIYFVRLCVPARYKIAVGKGELHRTTGCRDYRLAKIVAAELAAHWHRAIQVLEHMDISKVKAGSIELLGEGHVSLTEAAAVLGSSPLALATQLFHRHTHFYVNATAWLGWPIDDMHESLPLIHDDMGQVEVDFNAAAFGGPQAKRSFTGRLRLRFRQEVTEGLRDGSSFEVCQFLTGSPLDDIDRGFVCDPGYNINADMLQVRKIDVESLRISLASQMAFATPGASLGISGLLPFGVASDTSPKFSEFFIEYLKRHEGYWKSDQIRRRNDHRDLFLDLMGDVHLAKIDRACMRLFSDRIKKVPDDRHLVRRKYECPNATFSELITLADLHDLPRLTESAQHRVLDGLSEVFHWAVKETLMPANPGVGLGSEIAKRSTVEAVKPKDQRDPLSESELKKVFSAKWFSDGVGKRTAKGKFHAYRPHYYWLPLLALFNGGRLNELSQLYLDDIKVVDGIACLDFNLMTEDKRDIDEPAYRSTRATDKSLKTANSVRDVPIHQTLLDLGFLDYVEALRKNGYSRLFPELKFNPIKGYGKAAGSWFNERYMGIELLIPRNGRKTFHSMRHNFATRLGVAEVELNLKRDLMGHMRKGSESDTRYDKGVLENAKLNIDKIDFPLPAIARFIIADGLEAISDALKLKGRHSK